MPLYLNLHADGALLEDAPSDSFIGVELPERETEVLLALCKLESFELAKALGSLALFAVKEPKASHQPDYVVG